MNILLKEFLLNPWKYDNIEISKSDDTVSDWKEFFEELKENKVVSSLRILGTFNDIAAINYLSELLNLNTNLTSLILDGCNINDTCVKSISSSLILNHTLKNLNLNANGFGLNNVTGIINLSESLKLNSSLTNLNLASNYLKDQGANYLSEALKVNRVLTELNLESNKIQGSGILSLLDSLQKNNSTLSSLNIESNSNYNSENQLIISMIQNNLKKNLFFNELQCQIKINKELENQLANSSHSSHLNSDNSLKK